MGHFNNRKLSRSEKEGFEIIFSILMIPFLPIYFIIKVLQYASKRR